MAINLDFGIPLPAGETIATIGTFDGVHRGHQHLIKQVIRRARETGRLSAAVTFVPHPRTVLRPELPLAYLATSEERVERLRAQGFDLVVVAPFTRELAATPAEVFMSALTEQLRMRELWVGHDFSLGRGREGNTERLREIGARLGCDVHLVEPLLEDGLPINSTRIRELISAGEIEHAARLLGRRYQLSGKVIPGRHVGRSLGIRTANIACDPERVIPANGVYAAWVNVRRERRMAAVNIGVRPSFGLSERLLEVHVLEYDGDLYDTQLDIEFVHRLRAELKFESVADLVAQVRCDIAETRALLRSDLAEAR